MDLTAALSLLRRRWWIVVTLVFAGLAGGYSYGHLQAPVYSASATSYVNLPISASSSLGTNLAGVQLSSAYVKTYAEIVTSRDVAAQVASTTHVPLSAAQVSASLSAVAVENTFLIRITARASDPERAAALANAAAEVLHQESLTTLQPSDAKVVATTIDPARPPGAPVSPNPGVDDFLGLVFGLLVGAALIAALEALDRSVKTGKQIADLTDSPLLGAIPKRRGGVAAATQDAPNDIASEAYRALRTAVRFLDPDAPLRTILVTSPSPGDGKTTTAANLAIAHALGGERVILVDGDLRRASVGTYFGLESAVGVTTILRRQVSLRDALQQWSPRLRILPSGALPPNPSELLGSQAMSGLIERFLAAADIVIIDGAPVLPVTDAVALATQVDGVVLVARHGKTTRTALAEAARRLTAVGANVAGTVLNAQPAREAREYYVEYQYREVLRPRPTPTAADAPEEATSAR